MFSVVEMYGVAFAWFGSIKDAELYEEFSSGDRIHQVSAAHPQGTLNLIDKEQFLELVQFVKQKNQKKEVLQVVCSEESCGICIDEGVCMDKATIEANKQRENPKFTLDINCMFEDPECMKCMNNTSCAMSAGLKTIKNFQTEHNPNVLCSITEDFNLLCSGRLIVASDYLDQSKDAYEWCKVLKISMQDFVNLYLEKYFLIYPF